MKKIVLWESLSGSRCKTLHDAYEADKRYLRDALRRRLATIGGSDATGALIVDNASEIYAALSGYLESLALLEAQKEDETRNR